MALPTTIADRMVASGSVATMPAPVKSLISDELRQKCLIENRWNREVDLDLEGPSVNWAGWEVLNEAGYGRELWLGADVLAALAEWRELWGDKPDKDVYPRYSNQGWRSEKKYDVLRTIRDKRASGFYSKSATPGEPPASPVPDSVMDKANADLDAEMRQLHGAPPLPQAMQSADDVAALIGQTAGKLRPTNDNIRQAVKEQAKPSLAAELAAIPVTGTNEEVVERAALGPVLALSERVDELIDDIKHGLEHFDERQDANQRVQLIDGCYLKRNGIWINLKHPALLSAVVIQTKVFKDDKPMVTIRRQEILNWLKKVEEEKGKHPFASRTTHPTGAPRTAGPSPTLAAK